MRSDSMADATFGINAQALAILAVLNQQEPTFADYNETEGRYRVCIDTYPWHNGREHGVAITIQRDFCGRGLVIVFGECRNSDSIFVDSWEMDRLPSNGPTVRNFTEQAYAQREYTGYRDFNKAIDIIIDKAARFYAIVKATAKGK